MGGRRSATGSRRCPLTDAGNTAIRPGNERMARHLFRLARWPSMGGGDLRLPLSHQVVV